MNDDVKARALRSRNKALGLVIFALVALFYGLALVRVG